MAYEQKDNSGAIFKNDKKGNDKAPDYRGKIMVDGKEKEIALWVKKSNSGISYFSVALKEPYNQAQPESKSSVNNDIKDDLPF